MVRNIVGTLVDVGNGKRAEDSVAKVLEGRNRTKAGPTAPPHGLCLVRVMYEDAPPPG
jgi:tRNA pseudouridine38-40 synthase